MSFSSVLSLLLVFCWVLPALVVVVLYRMRTSSGSPDEEGMDTALRGIRAEILQVDYSARSQGWRSEDWEGPASRVQSRVRDESHEVMVVTPYAEASVTVGEEDDEERRRCSLCLN